MVLLIQTVTAELCDSVEGAGDADEPARILINEQYMDFVTPAPQRPDSVCNS
jgi:hypothetical protein